MEKPKEIVIFSQFCDPEPCAASNRVATMARSLAKRGDRVTIVTGMPTFPKGIVHEAYRGLNRCLEYDGTIRILRRRAPLAKPGAFAGRARNWISLAMVLAWTAIAEIPRPDTVIVTSPPITMSLPALLASWRHRAALVIDVRDVFPDMGVRLGVWKADSLVVKALGAFVNFLYSRASIVVAVTESARQSILARGVPPQRVMLAPNGFDFSQKLQPRRRGARDTFEVAYAGNMGLATGVDMILDAAKMLLDRTGVRFVLAGGGLDAARIAKRIEDEALTNVKFVGVLSRTESLDLLAEADAAIVPLHRGLVDAIPSKMFDALAVGCPMIVSARGEAVSLLRASGSGIDVEPNDAKALAAGIERCIAERDALERRSEAGKSFVRANYDRERIMQGLAQAIGGLA